MANNPPTPAPTRNPLADIAKKVGTGWSAIAGVIGALVTYGVLSGAQGDAITAAGAQAQDTVTAFGTVLGGMLPLISGVIAAFSTAKTGEGHVTPLADPRDNAGNRLVPAAGAVTQSPQSGATVADRDPGRSAKRTINPEDTWT